MSASNDFYAVILSGGSGERFWPLSTPDRPKQFLTVFGGRSLIRQAVDRLAPLVPSEHIILVTAASLVHATREELPEIPEENIIAEPCRRDTAAAVATACGVVEKRAGLQAVVAILTADHLMTDEDAFRQVLADSVQAARSTNSIVTMGVKPTYPATGFGYIHVGEACTLPTQTTFSHALQFVEKPTETLAKSYLASRGYVWNAGMFVWRVQTMKESLTSRAPALACLETAVARATDLTQTLVENYAELPKISIDYAVMEKAPNILVSSGDFGWDDVGTWSSTDRHLAIDGRRNVAKGNVTLLDVSDTVAIAEGPQIAALGVKNLVIVSTKDAILVADKSRVQDLKKLLQTMGTP